MLRVNEIFTSISGEVNAWGQGCASTFIRLQGCNLRCDYCDTPKSQQNEVGMEMDVAEVLEQIKTRHVTITGGEPLLQVGTYDLINQLQNADYLISVETNGTIAIPIRTQWALRRISWIVDFKCDKPGAMVSQPWSSSPNDWWKFIISQPGHVSLALSVIKQHGQFGLPNIAFSALPPIRPEDVFSQVLAAGIKKFSINFQLHKLIDWR